MVVDPYLDLAEGLRVIRCRSGWEVVGFREGNCCRVRFVVEQGGKSTCHLRFYPTEEELPAKSVKLSTGIRLNEQGLHIAKQTSPRKAYIIR